MTKTQKLLGLGACLLALGDVARAADDGHFSLGLGAGSLGGGPELGYRFGPHVGLRSSLAVYTYGTDNSYDGISYQVDLKLNSWGGDLDWYPFGGGFRLSAGARANNNELRLLGRPTTATQIGGTTYTPAQIGSLSGTIAGRSFAPSFTFGYGGTFARGFSAGGDLGVMLQGSPRLRDLRADGLLAQNPAFQTDLRAEAAKIENDASGYKLWPVLQLKLLYRF
jgi:hypothetical protein